MVSSGWMGYLMEKIKLDRLMGKLNDESNDEMEMEDELLNLLYLEYCSLEGTRSDVNSRTCLNQTNITSNNLFQNKDESYDDNFSLIYSRESMVLLKDLNCHGKKTWQLQDKCEEVVEESLKRKKSVERVSSLVIGLIQFLWFMRDIYSKLLPQHGPLFIWFSLLEVVGCMVFVCAMFAMIIIGAPFTPLQRGMLMFWTIWMLVRSAKSLTELYLPMLGILLMGCYVLVEKKAPR